MKVFNWDSWEECEKYFTKVLPPSNPPGLPQGKSYYLVDLYSFFLHWRECKRLVRDLLKEKNEGVTDDNIKLQNQKIVLAEFGIPDLDDNLNTFLAYYHYSIYV